MELNFNAINITWLHLLICVIINEIYFIFFFLWCIIDWCDDYAHAEWLFITERIYACLA